MYWGGIVWQKVPQKGVVVLVNSHPKKPTPKTAKNKTIRIRNGSSRIESGASLPGQNSRRSLDDNFGFKLASFNNFLFLACRLELSSSRK
jgi:hypothetical protein